MSRSKRSFLINASITILATLILLIIPFFNYKNQEENKEERKLNQGITKEFSIDFSNKKSGKEIFSEEHNIQIDKIESKKINDNYESIFINENDKIESAILNLETESIVEIDSIIKEGKDIAFQYLINTEACIKYPKFISDELIKNETLKTYEFLDSGINVYFSNYQTNPVFEEKTSIKLTCSMINDLLDFECETDNDLKDPNIPQLDENKKSVAITFDDGPAGYTDEIIESLKENHANATFFVVGTNSSIYINTLKKAIENNNEIGLHSFSHKNLIKLNDEQLNIELNNYKNNLSAELGYDITLVRPPYGTINEKIKNNYNYSYILWSVDTEDWSNRNKDITKERALEDVKDGDIILMHDIHKSTKEAIKEILPELYVRGYQVVTISNLAKLKNTPLELNKVYRKF